MTSEAITAPKTYGNWLTNRLAALYFQILIESNKMAPTEVRIQEQDGKFEVLRTSVLHGTVTVRLITTELVQPARRVHLL